MSRRATSVDDYPPVTLDGQARWEPPPPARDRRRGRRGRGRKVAALAVVAGLLATMGVVAVSRSGGDGGTEDGADAGPSTSTAKVTRQDLVARTEVDGTLGYAGELAVLNQAQGTVTWVPKVGTVVERGQPLYSIANRPVPLLYGDLPAWRRLAENVDGDDTLQLEENLVALGHATESEMLVDGKFTAATTTAVKRWQKAMDVEQTGVVEPGEAVFLPGALRVADVKAAVGGSAPPGSPVLSGTSTSRVVTLDLDAAKQSLVKAGDKVEIRLPNGSTTAGTVADVGTVARAVGQGDKRAVTVTVTPDDPSATGALDQAPVKVGITTSRRPGVLAVPVNALLALAEGGYGVRVGGQIVVVETGLFSRGLVEVSGQGLVEGADVEVPAR